MPFSEPLSVILRRDYGFTMLTASPIQKDYEVYEEVRERLKRPDLPFRPVLDVCYERRISKYTYLIIEGLCVRNKHGVVLRQEYCFYKATYFYGDRAQKINMSYERSNVLTF